MDHVYKEILSMRWDRFEPAGGQITGAMP
jgi:hypothetical protein